MSDAEQAWNDVAALWAAVFGEAPPVCCEPGMLLDVLVRNLAAPLPYQPGIAEAERVSEMIAALDRRADGEAASGGDVVAGEAIASFLVERSTCCDIGIS